MSQQSSLAALRILEARSGSRNALGQLLEMHRKYLIQIARQEMAIELQPKGGASDLVQDTFLEAQRDFDQFQGNSEAELRAWLRQMLLHQLGKFARRYRTTKKRQISREVRLTDSSLKRTVDCHLSSADRSRDTQVSTIEQAEAVAKAMSDLPEDYCRVIRLRHQEHRSFDEIAQIMGRSLNAVRKLWARAIERLQQELETGE